MSIVNIDAVVTCEHPKRSYRASFASALELPIDAVFVKGKINEGCNALSEGRAVEALVVCLPERV
ncbi:MAG: hypothetical protein LBD79_09110 [Treponema sp.]|nr:hypothetical protein [Treponema sp.]